MPYYGGSLTGADKQQYQYGTPEYKQLAAAKAAAGAPVMGPQSTNQQQQTGVPGGPPSQSANTPPPNTTFQPPAPAAANPQIAALTTKLGQQMPTTAPATDPKMQALMDQLQQQIQGAQAQQTSLSSSLSSLGQPVNIAPPDFSGVDAQAQGLQGLLAQLMRGEGVKVDPATAGNDPRAAAYQVAAQRNAEAARRAEADRQGASGTSGSGDFDARAAQIREASGQDIAGYNANLTDQRRSEALQGATTAAGLSLSDLDRQRGQKQQTYESQFQNEALRRQGLISDATLKSSTGANNMASQLNLLQTLMSQANSGRDAAQQMTLANRGSDQSLLNTLLSSQGQQQGLATDTAFRTAEEQRRSTEAAQAAKMAELQRQLAQQQVNTGNRATGGSVVGGRVGR